MKKIETMLPEPVKAPLRRLRNGTRTILYWGDGRLCPVCGRPSRRFLRYGSPPREDAQCPRCTALERHRFVWLFLSRRTDLFDGRSKRMLHVAPELCFEPSLRRRLGEGYLTADRFSPRAMVEMDISRIDYPDRYFDVIYCSHVLEHVPDDAAAMRELHRVLKDDGWAILIVPILVKETFEDLSVADPKGRLRVYGQDDHVRKYGPDYVDRLRAAGFDVEVVSVDALVRGDEKVRMALTPASGDIYYCTKRPREKGTARAGKLQLR